MMSLIQRDLMILFREPKGWLLSLVFFVLFLSLLAIALGADSALLRSVGAPAFWLAVTFSLLLTFDTLFESDIRSGLFEQFRLSGISPVTLVISKFITVFLTSVIPLILVAPLAGLLYQMNFAHLAPIILSLLFGTPAIIALGVTAAALLAGQRTAGFLIILLTLPFLVPVLIFALAGIEAYSEAGLWNTGFQALMGFSLVSIAIGIPASAAALTSNME